MGLALLCTTTTFAQNKKTKTAKVSTTTDNLQTHAGVETPQVAVGSPQDQSEAMKFQTDVHDFGNIPEGPAAEYEFTFKNTGKEPIIIQRAQPSCGCTTPSYSKDPVLPGKTGSIKASYGTQGRPSVFTKTITVVTNVGTKVLTIKGNVEKAPESSVPANTSMIKTH